MRVWPADEYTRVTIESDAALSARHFVADNPSRLVVDIDGLELSPALRELVGKVRAATTRSSPACASGRTSRASFAWCSTSGSTRAPQVFTLAPVAAYRYRLVFDLYPTTPPDPLLALIREKELAEQQAAAAVKDALGELIGKLDKPPLAPRLPPPPPAPPRRRRRGRRRLPSRRRRRWRRAGSTAWSSSRSTPATAAKTRAPSARAACARRTWCSPSRCSCAST